MRWLLLDLAIALLSLALLAALLLGLWRRVKALGREVERAGEVIGAASDQLARLQDERPVPLPAGSQLSSRVR